MTLRKVREFTDPTDARTARTLTRQIGEFEDNSSAETAEIRKDYHPNLKPVARETAEHGKRIAPGQSLGVDTSDGDLEIVLDKPSAKNAGRFAAVYKRLAANTVTLRPDDGALINGLESLDITTASARQVLSDGVDYWVDQPILRWHDVTAFGAKGGGVDDTEAIQAATDAAWARYVATGVEQVVYYPPLRYGITPSATSSWAMPLSGTTAEVHIGVHLRSGVTHLCDGAEFVALPPAGAQAAWHYFLFGTDLNMTVGDLERVRLIRPRFDFTETYWTTGHVSLYGVVAVGVDTLAIENAKIVSTGTQNGRLAKVLNCANVRVPDVEALNITQVCFFGYVTGLEFSGSADTFVEAWDLDAPCYHVRGIVTCRNGTGEAQCLDIASVQDGYFELTCEAVGNAAIIYQKLDGHPTFADWVVDFPAGTSANPPVFSKRITLHVTGTDIHSSDLRSVQLNLDRTSSTDWDGIDDHMRDIRVIADLTDCDPFLVYEGENLDLDISMRDVTTGSAARINNAAVILRSARVGAAPIAESKLSGRARIKVVNSDRTGVRVSGPTNLDIECDVDGYNSADDAGSGVASGVWFEDLARKNGMLTIRNMVVSNGDTTVAPVDLRFTWDGSTGTTHLRDLGGHRLTTSGGGATALTVAYTTTPQAIQGGLAGPDTYVATIDTAAGTPADANIRVCGQDRLRLVDVRVINVAAVAAGGANFTSLSMRRLRAGTVGTVIGTDTNYDVGVIAAGTSTRLEVDGTDPDGIFEPGDILVLRGTRQGTGSTLTGLYVKATFMEYSV